MLKRILLFAMMIIMLLSFIPPVANAENAYIISSREYETKLKQQAFSQTGDTSSNNQINEVDEAHQRMLERENYVVEVINNLSDASTCFDLYPI